MIFGYKQFRFPPVRLVFLLLLFAPAARAQEPAVHHSTASTVARFVSGQIKATAKDLFSVRDPWQLGAYAYQWTGAGLDFASTSQVLHACPTCYEGGPIAHGSRNALRVNMEWASVELGVDVLSSFLHRAAHHGTSNASGGQSILYALSSVGPVLMGTGHIRQFARNEQFFRALTPADKVH